MKMAICLLIMICVILFYRYFLEGGYCASSSVYIPVTFTKSGLSWKT